ncbi:hypothetical protein UFOVP76_55, partial [uncultured Caudovirales phage]
WDHDIFAFPIVCWIQFDPPEPASWDCPGSPMSASVMSAFCAGVSIRGILAPWIINQIEDDFLDDIESDVSDARALDQYDDDIKF